MGHSLFAWGDIYMDVKRVLSRGMSSSKNSKQWHFNDPRLINVHMSSVIKTVHYTWQCMSTTYCSSAQTKRTRQMFESIMEEQFEITKQLNRLSYPRMTIKKNDLGVTVHHMGYIDSLVTKFSADPNSHVKCPTGTEFLSHDKEDVEVNKTK